MSEHDRSPTQATADAGPADAGPADDRPALDLSLYLVTDTAMTLEHGITATVRQAVAGGVTVVQLRDPDARDEEFVALGRLLRAVLNASGVPLIVNDRVHLVQEIGAHGAHVGQGDLDPVQARQILGPTAYLGLSCSTEEHLRAAAELPVGTVDYLGIGPVRATATKPDHASPLGVDGALALARLAPVPAVAIGGVDGAITAQLAHGDLAGVAVVSAICAAPDPRAAAEGLVSAWQEGRR